MRVRFVSLALSAVLFGVLGACVPDPALVEVGLVQAPAPQIKTGIYGASIDGTVQVAAVPVEKVPTEFQRQTVYYPTEQVPGTVVINPAAKHLYLVTGKNTALRYGISVGREGFQWSGEALITNRKHWPTWTPPPEMIERTPELIKWEKGQPGGPTNPLGARALYLTTEGVDYGYRIHGTPEWDSIGRNASSGCIRMINQDVMDLYERVPDGSKVIVLTASGELPKGLTLPPPAPKKVVAKPAVAAKEAPAVTTASAVTTAPAITTAPVAPAASAFTPPPLPAMLPIPPAVVVPAPV